MSEQAHTELQKALQRIRNAQAIRLGWRVLSCSSEVYDGTDLGFYYIQGQSEPNYPVPMIYPAS